MNKRNKKTIPESKLFRPKLLDGLGRYLGMVLRGTKNLFKQLPVYDIVLLVDPKAFQQVMGVILVLGVELLEPLLGYLDDLVRVALA